MEKTWNRKKIGLLINADPQTLEIFWDQFVPVLYTWMYYQVGADEQLAYDLFGETLEQALRNISQFNPAQETLFQWLKKQAGKTRDFILEHRQLHPQRPWAWSQLSETIVKELSRLRSEPLNEAVFDNPFVKEIVQASLAELETTDRQLLMYRYNRLESEENIAEEMQWRIEDVQNRLYRSRHSFRRSFFHLLSLTNTGFGETIATGDIEMLDTNMEKLLSSTSMYHPLDKNQSEVIRKRYTSLAEEIAASQPPAQNGKLKNPVVIITGIVIVLLIAVIGIFLISQNDKQAPMPEPEPTATTKTPEPETEMPETEIPKIPIQKDIEKEELELALEMAKQGNVDALLELLKSGRRTTQITAAILLGQLAGPEAIEHLQQAEQMWYPDLETNNPFAQAIQQILSRHPEFIPMVFVEETPSPEEPNEPLKEEPNEPPVQDKTPDIEIQPWLSGTVTGFSNEPLAGITVELAENPLFSGTNTNKIDSTKTDENGRFKLPESYDGPVYLTVTGQGPETIKRSLFCTSETNQTINFEGRPSLTGSAFIDGIALSNQTLYLCDTPNPEYSSYWQKTETDNEGNFTFLGVLPGDYVLLNRGLDNRIHQLQRVTIPAQEVFNLDVEIETAGVILEYPEGSQRLTVSYAELVYMPQASEDLKTFKATISQDGTIVFSKVIPGSYTLRVQLDNGIWVHQEAEVAEGPGDTIVSFSGFTEEEDTAVLSGQFLSMSPVDLILKSSDERIYADLLPQADGSFRVESLQADFYTVGAFVNSQFIEFFQVDVLEEPEVILDVDPEEIIRSVSPLNVLVLDASGFIVTGADIWMTGNEQVINSTSTGKGTFLAVPAGSYSLSVAYPGYPSQSRDIEAAPSSLEASPQTIIIELTQ